jgi:hypothetical protein
MAAFYFKVRPISVFVHEVWWAQGCPPHFMHNTPEPGVFTFNTAGFRTAKFLVHSEIHDPLVGFGVHTI